MNYRSAMLNRYALLVVFLATTILQVSGQAFSTGTEIEKHTRYLASDELKGRKTGTAEIEQAAQYIANFFSKYGLISPSATEGYFQTIKVKKTTKPDHLFFKSGNISFKGSDQILLLQGKEAMKEAALVFAGYGLEEDLQNLDLKGKMVVTYFGYQDSTNVFDYLVSLDAKTQRIYAKGATALIEVVKDDGKTWKLIQRLFDGRRYDLNLSDTYQNFHHVWINDPDSRLNLGAVNQKTGVASIEINGYKPESANSKNVIGMVKGSDPTLQDDFILLTAHYDHIGVGEAKVLEDGRKDSIFNGARDNAVGTVALMMAAKALAGSPPARSVLFVATTAEEEGLLGSRWYALFPPIPLRKTVFNVNIDGAGYNDTSITTVVGLSRTDASEVFHVSCRHVGLDVFTDPEIDKHFYTRSDNVHFAWKGIPSLTYSMGFKTFDQELTRYYHQVIDEADDLDYAYLAKWVNAYVQTVRTLADMPTPPFWNADDPLWQKGRNLYGLN